MSTLSGWLLQNALLATAGAVVLALVLRRWQLPARVEHVLWTVIALKFLLPPFVQFPVPFAGDVAPAIAEGVAGMRVQAAASADAWLRAAPVVAPAGEAQVPAAVPLPQQRAPLGTAAIIVIAAIGLWVLGMLVTFAVQIGNMVRWRRRLRAVPGDERLVALVREVADTLGMTAPVVMVEATLHTPVVLNPIRPQLLWPEGLHDVLSADGARMVVAHELAHIRRGDLWLGTFELLANSVWWWYPGWHLVRRRRRDAGERASDAEAVALYPSLRRVYAATLLDIMAGVAPPPPLASPALRGVGAARRRLEAVLADPPAPRRPVAMAVPLLLLVLAPAWTLPTSGARDGTGPSQDAPTAGTQDSTRAQILRALAHARSDPDAGVRRAVVNALRDFGGDDATALLQRLAADSDARVAGAARMALGLEAARPNRILPAPRLPSIRSAWQLDSLATVLRAGTPRERLEAANLLGNLRDPRTAHALIAALGDRDFHVRQSAASALGAMGAVAAAADLIPLLGDPHPRVRQSAAGALIAIPTRAAVPALIGALRDEDDHVRAVAASALGNVGGAAATAALITALEDESQHVRRVVVSALSHIGSAATP